MGCLSIAPHPSSVPRLDLMFHCCVTWHAGAQTPARFRQLTVTAGYDVSTRESYEETIRSFNDTVGLKFLKGMHINDSKCGCTASTLHVILSLAAIGLLKVSLAS